MPEETVLEQQEEQVLENAPETKVNQDNFRENFWNDTPMQVKKEGSEVQVQQQQQQQQEQKKEDEEILDPKDWLKREFEIDDPEVLKSQIKEYKELKNKQPETLKFENEESEKIFNLLKEGKSKEVKQYLEQQERLEQFTAVEVTKENAGDIIKMGMQIKHPNLTADEINHKYNKQFGIPKAPVQSADELDEEFAQRKQDWEEKVRDIEMERTIEAKMYQPELANAKTKLVLPEINKPASQAQQPTQEELEAAKKDQEAFLQIAKAAVDSFEGFSTQVKNKDVDYSVNYALSPEEKTAVSERVKAFAESGFDANMVFADRWVKDGKLNEAQMIEDLSRVLAGKNADAKLASEAANQRLELYLKEKKQINVNGNPGGNFNPEAKTATQKMQENFWGS